MEEEVCRCHYDCALWHINKERIRDMEKYHLKEKKKGNVDRSLQMRL
jgi:hypothetical protein